MFITNFIFQSYFIQIIELLRYFTIHHIIHPNNKYFLIKT